MLRALGASLVVAALGAFASAACGSAETVKTGTIVTCPAIIADGGDTIPPPPDGVMLCPSGACNYQSQDGCGADTACQPTQVTGQASVEPGCVPAGSGHSGEPCDADNACDKGFFCANGYCRKLCCGRDWSACDEGESCFRNLLLRVGSEVVDSGAWLCFPVNECDVLTSATCEPQGFDCKMVDPRGKEACLPPSPEQLGEPCSGDGACARGLTCVGDPGEAHCRRLCRAEECGEPACPPEEGLCVHFNRDPPLVGECTPGFTAPKP